MEQQILDEGYRNLSSRDEATILRLQKENAESEKRIINGRVALMALPVFTIGLVLFYYQENFFRVLLRGIPLFSHFTNLVSIGLLGYSFTNPRVAFIIGMILYILFFFYTLINNGFFIPTMIVVFLVFLFIARGFVAQINIDKNNLKMERLINRK